MNRTLAQFVPSETDQFAVEQLAKSLGISTDEAIEKGNATDTGVWFKKTGAQIKKHVEECVIPELKKQLNDACKKYGCSPATGKKLPITEPNASTETYGVVMPAADAPPPVESDPETYYPGKWEVERIRRNLKRAELICQQIEPKRTFQLSIYDLENLGMGY